MAAADGSVLVALREVAGALGLEVLEFAEESGGEEQSKRRTWEEMDALRARMAREGYALDGLDARERERVWRSLAGGTRRGALMELMGMSQRDLVAALARVRLERLRLTGRR